MHIPPNWGTFGLLIVSFLVFWFIFSRIFFRPFLDLLSKRETRFKDLSDRTELLLKQAKAAEAERETRLAEVRREETGRREAERRTAEADAVRLLEEAKADARATLERARAHLEEELTAAEQQLDAMGRSLAGELAEKVLGRPLNGSHGGTSN